MNTLAGVHPVREALCAGRLPDHVLVLRGAGSPRVQEIVDLCRQLGVPVRFVPRDALDRAAGGAVHQGVVALGASITYAEWDSVLASRLLIVLDGVEDPHNLGAIIRTAHAAGAGGVIIPERRSAGITATVAKAAAGALEHLPVVRAGNVHQTLEKLKKAGFWTYGLDERGDKAHTEISYAVPTALFLGGEGQGLHLNVRKDCDFLVRIPMAGEIPSLNVSVAAGVVMFEWRRQLEASLLR